MFSKRLQYRYDAARNRVGMTDPDGGRFTYAYDVLNKLSEMVNPQGERTTYAYDAAGRRTSVQLGNGTRTSGGKERGQVSLFPPIFQSMRPDPFSAAPWERSKNHPFPTYEDDGYYLEDAEWLAQFLPDIKPPCEEALHELEPGDTVKLVFRFREESAPRGNKQCERMWVQITEYDEDEEIFTGILDNDPHHQGAIRSGDELCFLSSHVIEVYTEDDD